MSEVAETLAGLDGIREKSVGGLTEWRFHGRLVARQLDFNHLVIRADFDYRDAIVRQLSETFSVPRRFAKHMMVVANVESGDRAAIEDALVAAYELRRREGPAM